MIILPLLCMSSFLFSMGENPIAKRLAERSAAREASDITITGICQRIDDAQNSNECNPQLIKKALDEIGAISAGRSWGRSVALPLLTGLSVGLCVSSQLNPICESIGSADITAPPHPNDSARIVYSLAHAGFLASLYIGCKDGATVGLGGLATAGTSVTDSFIRLLSAQNAEKRFSNILEEIKSNQPRQKRPVSELRTPSYEVWQEVASDNNADAVRALVKFIELRNAIEEI